MTKSVKQILEEDLQTIGLEDDARSTYTFDFAFLKKQRRKEKIRLASLVAAIVFLFIVLIGITVSYRNYVNKYENLVASLEHPKSTNKKENICPTSDNNEVDKEKADSCKCPDDKFVKDEDGKCRDINFAIKFMKDSQEDISCHSRQVFDIPDIIDEMTLCFWYNNNKPKKKSTLFKYYAFNLRTNDVLEVSLQNGSIYSKLLNEEAMLFQDGSTNTWTHLCYQWQDSGNSTIYINGSLHKTIVYNDNFTRDPLPTTYGVFVMGGQEKSSFIGSISQLFVYSRILSFEEILMDFQKKPTMKEVILGWWQFKGQCVNDGYSKEDKFPL